MAYQIYPGRLQEDAEVSEKLIYLGYICLKDPVRPNVKEAIELLAQKSGIRVRMVTGDSTATAIAVA